MPADRWTCADPLADGVSMEVTRSRAWAQLAVAASLAASLGACASVTPSTRVGPGAPPAVGPHLPTSSWTPDEPGMMASAQGRLVRRGSCLLLARTVPGHPHRLATPFLPIWPRGWTATREQPGRIALHDPSGRVVARSGDLVRVGGGFGSSERPTGRCAARYDSPFEVNSGVTLLTS